MSEWSRIRNENAKKRRSLSEAEEGLFRATSDYTRPKAQDTPRQWPVIDYIREEVSRQGHDVTKLDGIERVSWMMDAWCMALTRAEYSLDITYVEELGRMVERSKNRDGFRTCGVSVGLGNLCPPAHEVRPRLDQLFKHYDNTTPLEFYKEFELIHPFVDGNGRTGKILLNWKAVSLLMPFFPPADLWGAPIRNP
jgi:hypothetical protein